MKADFLEEVSSVDVAMKAPRGAHGPLPQRQHRPCFNMLEHLGKKNRTSKAFKSHEACANNSGPGGRVWHLYKSTACYNL